MDYDLRDSMKQSQHRRRLADIMDKLMKERDIKISETDSTAWHQLINDAERILKDSDRI